MRWTLTLGGRHRRFKSFCRHLRPQKGSIPNIIIFGMVHELAFSLFVNLEHGK